jgi:DNA-binding transcriptional ArsR family regulator
LYDQKFLNDKDCLMRETYEIETVEQMRAISDMLRIRIINTLEKQAMTATQLGEELGLAPSKVHYHVRELEKVGLLELVETREKGGILEKYYQPIAREISMKKALLSSPPDEVEASFREILDQIAGGFLRAFRQSREQEDSEAYNGMTISLEHLYLTREEHHNLMSQFNELAKPFEARRGIEGEKELAFSLLAYPPTEEKEEEPVAQTSKVWVMGAAGYSREELLKTRAAGRRLRISVIGICQFASDVTAALVDETIESFSIVGKLVASPEVKEVLKSKEKPE